MKTKKHKKIKFFILVYCLLVVVLFSGFQPLFMAFAVEDNRSAYSKVLDDLKIDESFKAEDYPDNEKDYSLQVIQVAETKGGELLVYVYQPSAKILQLPATKITISQTILNNYSPQVYDLTLLNSDGVFQKYRVDGLELKNDMVRYYEISEIFRAWNKDIDEIPIGENTTSHKAFSVAQRWTACTLEGQVYYDCEVTEVVEIKDLFVGFVEYEDGYRFITGLTGSSACQSHLVAFNSDHSIDELLEADVIFTHQSRSYDKSNYTTPVFGTAVTETKTLTHTDESDYTTKGNFTHKKYSWKTIQTPTEFFDSVEGKNVYNNGVFNVVGKTKLDDNSKSIISGMQYVLRFYESDYSEVDRRVVQNPLISTAPITVRYVNETAVTDVAILRLKFKYQGKTYNLGVVADMQTGSGKSLTNTDWSLKLDSWFEKLLFVIGIVVVLVGVLILLNLLGWLAPVLKFIGIVLLKVGKAIWLIISSPFVFIGSLFKNKG